MAALERYGIAGFFLLLGFLSSLPASAQEPPLFRSDDPIAFTIRAPLEQIFANRRQHSEEHPGVVILSEAFSRPDTVDVDIRTRGITRLDRRICRFPPLRLDFPKDSVDGTVFEGQNRLKLVTHCQDNRAEYEQYVLLESLAYRAYNLLTDVSFRVRLARITYEDTEGDRDPITRYGFLIEEDEAVAERTGWMALKVPGIPRDAVDPENLALAEIFQFMIGNTDWSSFSSDLGDPKCCHNSKPIGSPAGPVFTLLYDFDVSGLVNTRYANGLYRESLDEMGLVSVRERRFRGLCSSEPHWPATFARFNERRASIEALFEGQEGLDPEVLERTLKYIADFYEIINDPGKVRTQIQRRCRP
jgi:hypothetical protein